MGGREGVLADRARRDGGNRSGEPSLDTGPGTAVDEARQLVQGARDLIGNSGARWPIDLAPPVTDAEAGSED